MLATKQSMPPIIAGRTAMPKPLKIKDVHCLKRREHKHRQHKQDSQERQQPVAVLLPQAAHIAYRIY
jgi:hypothetical protein